MLGCITIRFEVQHFLCMTHGRSLRVLNRVQAVPAVEGSHHPSLPPPFVSYRDRSPRTFTVAEEILFEIVGRIF